METRRSARPTPPRSLACLVLGLTACASEREPIQYDVTPGLTEPGAQSGSNGAAGAGARPTSSSAGTATDSDVGGIGSEDAESTLVDPQPVSESAPIASTPIDAPTPSGCVTDVGAGFAEITCEGITYRVHVAPDCLTHACGLIVDVHGGTMTATMEDNNTELSRLGNDAGFIVVHPNAPGGLWNFAIHDALVHAFMLDIMAAYHVDEGRVHMTGFSQGGYMTWRFLCAYTDMFASVAPAAAAGAANISLETGCTFTGDDVPSATRDVLYMHGYEDALVNHANTPELMGNVIGHWGMDAGSVVEEGAGYTRTRHAAPDGRVLEFLEHEYAASNFILLGHCYPGSDDQTPTEPGQLMGFGCIPPNDFHWGEEVVEFFLAHPRLTVR